MKKLIKSALFLSLFALIMLSCKNKANEAETSEAEAAIEAKVEAVKYVADSEASKIIWKGFKPAGSHDGVISLESGELSLNEGELESGAFVISMGSLVVLDIPADDEGNGKLSGHLKSPDFFDVDQFPTATFEITGVETLEGKTMLSGNLTLKSVTNNIKFLVTVSETENKLMLNSETFTIDRSKWNVQYGSKSFFDNLGDKFINDDIELTVNVVAKKV